MIFIFLTSGFQQILCITALLSLRLKQNVLFASLVIIYVTGYIICDVNKTREHEENMKDIYISYITREVCLV